MKSFDWDDKYDVGVRRFNEQHMQLLKILNDVYIAMNDKQDKYAIAQILNDLLKYAKEHLTEEEACLKANKYPDFINHKKLHENFINKLTQFCKDFKADKFSLHFEIAVFLKNWITNHIMIVDKEYKDFLNSKGIH